jgi:aspartyl-tRNA(Asn)/glutamyl-tRNA(Gln) amidotransferase subunit A
MSDLPLSLAELAAAYAKRSLSPVEVTDALLARIDRLDGKLHAYIAVTADRARADAKTAEANFAAGKIAGPLQGVPLGLKDLYETAGIATTAHSKIRIDHVPATDCTVAARLAAAGTVLMGKLTTHEFAFGGPSFDLPWPPARNPWNTDHFTSGSSSGSAAAIIGGLAYATLGSDTGGSIRGPCALTGLAGIKPTYGLVSRAGVFPLSWTLDTVGPMTATIEDSAIMLQVIAGADPRDPTCADRPVPDYRAALRSDLKGLKIGLMRRWHEKDFPATAPMAAAYDEAAKLMRDLGGQVIDLDCPPLMDYHAPTLLILSAEAFAYHRADLGKRWGDYGEFLRERTAMGAFVPSADYIRATQIRRAMQAKTLALFDQVDLLVTCGAVGEAPRMEDARQFVTLEGPSFTTPFNLTGLPAASVLCGFGPNGLPLGLQIAARPFNDALSLAAAHAYERAAGWWTRRPTL